MIEQHEKFGKYILLEKLAMGGMAEVYLAKAPSAGGISKFVAIKRILPQFSENPDFIDMFKDEAKIAINLNHSNVVSIFEFGMEKEQFFLVLEYVEGRNLRQILNKIKKTRQQLSTEQILYVVKEVAAGLDNAHRCLDGSTGRPLNIIHRDMSPQNIMVSFEGEVKVIDFGIAKAESQVESTRAGTLKGKFGYMSPEQVDGKSVDLRTDIFSLGTVLWELLANDRLFVANNEMNTLRKIRDCQIPSLRKINPNIPQELDNIVNKALARDRNLRYQTSAALHKDLNRFLNRHYPDFSSQDFSVFIKNLYANEILETRKKLITYSRINFDGQSDYNDDKTEVTATITETGAEPRTAAPQKPKLPNIKTPNINFGNLKVSRKEIIRKSVEFQKNMDVNPLSTELDEQSFSGVTTTSSKAPRPTQTGIKIPKTKTNVRMRKASKWPQMIKNIALVAIFALGLYYLFVPDSDMSSTYLSSETQDPVSTQQVPGPKDYFSLMVTSKPSKAAIFIDGKRAKIQTPGMIRVPPHKSFVLELKKNGYLTARQKYKVVRNGQKAPLIVLQKELVGYLDIDVTPKTAIVYVNGEKLHQSPPVRGYAVPAGATISVKAINPFSQTEDEKLVVVDREQTEKVSLRLRAQRTQRPRAPSGRRNGR